MITADQLICHAVGDYILQSHWMATEKTKRSAAALAHVLTYAIPFLLLRPSALAMAIIVGSHFVIDRWRLARQVVWIKNHLFPPWEEYSFPPWNHCRQTGFPPDSAPWLAFWLLIIVDNLMHVLCNAIALTYL